MLTKVTRDKIEKAVTQVVADARVTFREFDDEDEEHPVIFDVGLTWNDDEENRREGDKPFWAEQADAVEQALAELGYESDGDWIDMWCACPSLNEKEKEK